MKAISPVPASLLTGGSRESFLKGRTGDLKGACKEFEAVFIEQMIKGMRRTVMKSGLFDGGMQEEIYQDLFDQQVARAMAEGKGIGLWQKLYEGLSKAEGRNEGEAGNEKP